MSSDDPEKAGLQPDYKISWEDLFQQVIKFVLGKVVSVETSSQRAVIKSKGCILSQVSSIRRGNRQNVNITFRNAALSLSGKMEWTFQASAKPIQEHDVICLLHGALKPTIIRLYDLGEYEKADERLLEARSGYVTAFSKEHLPRPNQCGRTLLSFVAGEGHEDIVKLLLETVDLDVKDGISSRTPLSRAAENGHEAVVKLLLETGKVEADLKDKSS
ncbi:hypothetical protein BKA65DRAFT_585287 [Rhexocercosporidium sp. MPI-PUGE-AT-0058]|nr:hypothetical protein BKA65DRAFT_585287 [Rhexocercosporidium sp. MPI-PUGE-AT-0058]